MLRHLLLISMFSVALIPCSAQEQQGAAVQQASPVSSPVLETSLEDALAVYDELKQLALAHHQLTEDEVRHATGVIRPHCFTLGLLTPETRQNIILLADAVLWQGQWMNEMYLAELGIRRHDFAPTQEGLSTLVKLSKQCEELLSDSQTSTDMQLALRELIQTLGGTSALQAPEKLEQLSWAKDYKTALVFFKELCAAASQQDEQTALAAIQEQREVLEYFQSGGKWETMRVNALASQFRDTLIIAGTFKHPFGSTVVPAELRSDARMQALAPFLDTLPELRKLLFQPLNCEH